MNIAYPTASQKIVLKFPGKNYKMNLKDTVLIKVALGVRFKFRVNMKKDKKILLNPPIYEKILLQKTIMTPLGPF